MVAEAKDLVGQLPKPEVIEGIALDDGIVSFPFCHSRRASFRG